MINVWELKTNAKYYEIETKNKATSGGADCGRQGQSVVFAPGWNLLESYLLFV